MYSDKCEYVYVWWSIELGYGIKHSYDNNQQHDTVSQASTSYACVHVCVGGLWRL